MLIVILISFVSLLLLVAFVFRHVVYFSGRWFLGCGIVLYRFVNTGMSEESEESSLLRVQASP